jgi:hypothetical protein
VRPDGLALERADQAACAGLGHRDREVIGPEQGQALREGRSWRAVKAGAQSASPWRKCSPNAVDRARRRAPSWHLRRRHHPGAPGRAAQELVCRRGIGGARVSPRCGSAAPICISSPRIGVQRVQTRLAEASRCAASAVAVDDVMPSPATRVCTDRITPVRRPREETFRSAAGARFLLRQQDVGRSDVFGFQRAGGLAQQNRQR